MTVADTAPTLDVVHDIPETAALLRCGRSTVYELLKNGELIGIKIGARRLVTHRSIVECVQRLEEVARAASEAAGGGPGAAA